MLIGSVKFSLLNDVDVQLMLDLCGAFEPEMNACKETAGSFNGA